MDYEYRMVQAAPTVQAEKKGGGQDAAKYLEALVNREAVGGWEFYRMDPLTVTEAQGCLLFGVASPAQQFYVITFRRPRLTHGGA